MSQRSFVTMTLHPEKAKLLLKQLDKFFKEH